MHLSHIINFLNARSMEAEKDMLLHLQPLNL